jgi:hypothetical protein
MHHESPACVLVDFPCLKWVRCPIIPLRHVMMLILPEQFGHPLVSPSDSSSSGFLRLSLPVLWIKTFRSAFHECNSLLKDLLIVTDEPKCFARKESRKTSPEKGWAYPSCSGMRNRGHFHYFLLEFVHRFSIPDVNQILWCNSIRSLLIMKETTHSRLRLSSAKQEAVNRKIRMQTCEFPAFSDSRMNIDIARIGQSVTVTDGSRFKRYSVEFTVSLWSIRAVFSLVSNSQSETFHNMAAISLENIILFWHIPSSHRETAETLPRSFGLKEVLALFRQ